MQRVHLKCVFNIAVEGVKLLSKQNGPLNKQIQLGVDLNLLKVFSLN